jgi:hypothetical protein
VSISTDVQYIFKDRYTDDAVSRDVAKDHPLFADITRKSGFNGKGQFYSIKTAEAQGVGKTLAVGQAAISTTQGEQPYVTRVTQYGVIRLIGEDMKAAPNDGAFYDYVTEQTDSIMEEVGNDLALELYGDATGMRGRVSSINGQVLTLSNAEDVRKFSIGMTIVGDNNATGASPNAGSTTVTAIDEDTGTVTLAAGGVAAANIIANDYLFRYGDGGACVQGLGVCTPLTAPTNGDSFRTIDRSVNVRKLAGVRLTGSGAIEEDIGLLAVKCKQSVRRAFDRFYLNPINFHTVVQRTGSKIVYTEGGGDATVGFESIIVATEGGTVRLVSDPDCPTNLGYGVRMSEHFIWHLDEFPHIVRDDGRPSMKVYNADSIEIRIRAWWNYVQKMPGAFGVLSIV